MLSQHKDKYYANKLEKVLLKGIKTLPDRKIISFLRENIYPLYEIACKEANKSEHALIFEVYHPISQNPQDSQTLPKYTSFRKLRNIKPTDPNILGLKL